MAVQLAVLVLIGGVGGLCVGRGRRAYSNDMRNTARTLHWTLLLSLIERMYTIGAVA
jgi:hypothetical protein